MDTSFLDAVYAKIPAKQRKWHEDNSKPSVHVCPICNLRPLQWNPKVADYRQYCSSRCAHQSVEVREKTEQTCLVRYGTRSNLSSEDSKSKIRATLIERYGADNISKTEHFSKKFKETSMERYGVDNPSKSDAVKKKINDTHNSRYNRKRASQSHITDLSYQLKNDTDVMRHWYQDLKMPVSEIAERLGVGHSQLCIHFRDNLGIDISRHIVSRVEREISEFIRSIYSGTLETSVRSIISPLEIDIVLPDLKLGIEVDGLAWHTEGRGKDKNYHINKTQLAHKQGYRLVHILDSEWNGKREIVKSRLSGMVGVNQKIAARKCNVQQVSYHEAYEFFESSHIQGHCNASVTYGLYHQGQLVAAMSFGKPRFNSEYQWELIRFANSLYMNVVGAASRLLRAFERDYSPETIISYCDLRWNTGTVYHSIGFDEIRRSGPNSWYTRDYCRIMHRSNVQKHRLGSILEIFDPAQSAWENLQKNGYDRYWDCGNSVFVRKLVN